jgi:Glyoxalase-like domain
MCVDQFGVTWMVNITQGLTPNIRPVSVTHMHHVLLVDEGGRQPKLLLQRVDEAKTGKHRMHFDLETPTVDTEVARLEALGASRAMPSRSTPISGSSRRSRKAGGAGAPWSPLQHARRRRPPADVVEGFECGYRPPDDFSDGERRTYEQLRGSTRPSGN